MKEVDTDKDNQISFEEFIQMMAKYKESAMSLMSGNNPRSKY